MLGRHEFIRGRIGRGSNLLSHDELVARRKPFSDEKLIKLQTEMVATDRKLEAKKADIRDQYDRLPEDDKLFEKRKATKLERQLGRTAHAILDNWSRSGLFFQIYKDRLRELAEEEKDAAMEAELQEMIEGSVLPHR